MAEKDLTTSVEHPASPPSSSKRQFVIGNVEYAIIKSVLSRGLTLFKPIELNIDRHPRRVHDALMRLVKRGIIKKEGWGLYSADYNKLMLFFAQSILADHSMATLHRYNAHLFKNKEIHDTSPLSPAPTSSTGQPVDQAVSQPAGQPASQPASQATGQQARAQRRRKAQATGQATGQPSQPKLQLPPHTSLWEADPAQRVIKTHGFIYLDNIRGYTYTHQYLQSNKDTLLTPAQATAIFERITYAEISILTAKKHMRRRGRVIIYHDRVKVNNDFIESDKVEWRPPRGYYKKHTVIDAIKETPQVLMLALINLLDAVYKFYGSKGLRHALMSSYIGRLLLAETALMLTQP